MFVWSLIWLSKLFSSKNFYCSKNILGNLIQLLLIVYFTFTSYRQIYNGTLPTNLTANCCFVHFFFFFWVILNVEFSNTTPQRNKYCRLQNLHSGYSPWEVIHVDQLNRGSQPHQPSHGQNMSKISEAYRRDFCCASNLHGFVF